MPKFRHKPTEIDAIKTSNAMKSAARSWGALPKWLSDAYDKGLILFGSKMIEVTTPHGRATCQPEDWIIHGVAGEIYPCPDDILKKSYDEIPEEDHDHA